jgi:hypothetical protein
MTRRALTVLGSAVLLALGSHAQTTLIVQTTPVTAGVPFLVVVIDNGPGCIDALVTNVVTMMQPTGEVIAPELVGCGPISICLAAGQPFPVQYTTPAAGPGSSGSFVLLCPYGSGACARIDVGAPSPAFPDIHTYPTRMPHGPGAHHLPVIPSGAPEWEFSNTAAQAHAIVPTISILAPGGTTPLATASPALVVPAGGVVRTSLPIAGLAPGPYTVSVQWFDPGLSAVTTVMHGIEISPATGASIDLHLPGGKQVPFGGSIPARFAVRDPGNPWVPATWSYLLCAGVLPGSTPLPGGAIAPLVADAAVLASITNGINGLLLNNAGVTVSQGAYCAHAVHSWAVATGMGIAHPNIPGLSGAGARIGVVAYDPAGATWIASQPEDVTLQ